MVIVPRVAVIDRLSRVHGSCGDPGYCFEIASTSQMRAMRFLSRGSVVREISVGGGGPGCCHAQCRRVRVVHYLYPDNAQRTRKKDKTRRNSSVKPCPFNMRTDLVAVLSQLRHAVMHFASECSSTPSIPRKAENPRRAKKTDIRDLDGLESDTWRRRSIGIVEKRLHREMCTPVISPSSGRHRSRPKTETSSLLSTCNGPSVQPSCYALGLLSTSSRMYAVSFLPFLMSWTRTHFQMAESGCLASTSTCRGSRISNMFWMPESEARARISRVSSTFLLVSSSPIPKFALLFPLQFSLSLSPRPNPSTQPSPTRYPWRATNHLGEVL